MGIGGGTIRSFFSCCSTLAASEFAAGFAAAGEPKLEGGLENMGELDVTPGLDVGTGLGFSDVPFAVGLAKTPGELDVPFEAPNEFLIEPNVLVLLPPIEPNVLLEFEGKPVKLVLDGVPNGLGFD